MKEIKTEREVNPWKGDYNYEHLKELTDVKLSDNPPKPETLLKMANGKFDKDGNQFFADYFTVGDISVIVGKSGNGKSNLVALLISQMLNNNRKDRFVSELKADAKILVMDTEQSEYDVWRLTEKLAIINEGDTSGLSRVIVKRTEPLAATFRKKLLIDLMKDEKPALVVLDGVADILATINDEKEAKETIAEIRTIAQELKIHLVGIIHSSDKNTSSNEAMGWAGTVWKQKAEGQINVHYSRDFEEFVVQFHKARHGFPQDWKFKFDGLKGVPYIPKDADVSKTAKQINDAFSLKLQSDASVQADFWKKVIDLAKDEAPNGNISKSVMAPVMQIVWTAMAELPVVEMAPGQKSMKNELIDIGLRNGFITNAGTKERPSFILLQSKDDDYEV